MTMNELISISVLLTIGFLIAAVSIRLFYSIYSSYIHSILLNTPEGITDIWDFEKLKPARAGSNCDNCTDGNGCSK